jgi:hypothetical protein
MVKDIKDKKVTCADFFKDSYAGYADLCKQEGMDLTQLEGMRIYTQAYFWQGRAEFVKTSKMDDQTASEFLRLDTQKSLFASVMKTTQEDFSTQFGCKQSICIA